MAQPVEQLTRNEQVVRSNRISSSIQIPGIVENGPGDFCFISVILEAAGCGRAGRGSDSIPERPAEHSPAAPGAGWPGTCAAQQRQTVPRPAARAAGETIPKTEAEIGRAHV